MAKRTRKRKTKKASKNNLYLPIIIVLVIVFVFILYYFNAAKNTQPSEGPNGIPPTSSPVIPASVGGYCKSNFECFITSCKGQIENCINSTQMAIYSKNCKTYSDWIVGKQDSSKCACVQNACTMK